MRHRDAQRRGHAQRHGVALGAAHGFALLLRVRVAHGLRVVAAQPHGHRVPLCLCHGRQRQQQRGALRVRFGVRLRHALDNGGAHAQRHHFRLGVAHAHRLGVPHGHGVAQRDAFRHRVQFAHAELQQRLGLALGGGRQPHRARGHRLHLGHHFPLHHPPTIGLLHLHRLPNGHRVRVSNVLALGQRQRLPLPLQLAVRHRHGERLRLRLRAGHEEPNQLPLLHRGYLHLRNRVARARHGQPPREGQRLRGAHRNGGRPHALRGRPGQPHRHAVGLQQRLLHRLGVPLTLCGHAHRVGGRRGHLFRVVDALPHALPARRRQRQRLAHCQRLRHALRGGLGQREHMRQRQRHPHRHARAREPQRALLALALCRRARGHGVGGARHGQPLGLRHALGLHARQSLRKRLYPRHCHALGLALPLCHWQRLRLCRAHAFALGRHGLRARDHKRHAGLHALLQPRHGHRARVALRLALRHGHHFAHHHGDALRFAHGGRRHGQRLPLAAHLALALPDGVAQRLPSRDALAQRDGVLQQVPQQLALAHGGHVAL